VNTPSHRVSDLGDKVVIHDLEVFCAYDREIDGDHDPELAKFDNERVADIVDSTQQYMHRGSFPRLVVMHERDGKEPKSSVGRFTKIQYQERDGVGYIVGDCEVERSVFDKLLATNAFPRRSAEIWQEQNHLSEVALLGRETPRRPLPDTHFGRRGQRVCFSRPLRPVEFDMGTVGGGMSTYVPGTKDINMNEDLREEINALKAAMEEMKNSYKKRFGDDADKDEMAEPDADEMSMREGEAETMEADDMLVQQFAEEEGDGDGIHIDIDSHGDEDEEDEDEAAAFPASRPERFSEGVPADAYAAFLRFLDRAKTAAVKGNKALAQDFLKQATAQVQSFPALNRPGSARDRYMEVTQKVASMGRASAVVMRRENKRMARELATMRAELHAEKFAREIDAMEQEGYRIPAERRPQLIAELIASRDPAELLDTWRDLFARDPIGQRIDMSRASLPKGDIDARQISEMVREYAGRPADFQKALNSRIKR